jgi:hypothetical protein
MKEKFAVEIWAALSLILNENISALRELIKKLLKCFIKPALKQGDIEKRVRSTGSKQ